MLPCKKKWQLPTFQDRLASSTVDESSGQEVHDSSFPSSSYAVHKTKIVAVPLADLLILREGNPLGEIVAAELPEVVPAERPEGLDIRSL
jgi:hypothetical protein